MSHRAGFAVFTINPTFSPSIRRTTVFKKNGGHIFDYKSAYYHLFGEIASAVEDLEAGQPQKALSRLILAQRNAEHKFIESGDENPTIPFPKRKKKHNDPER